MSELEAIKIISQFLGWAGLLALTPFLYRLAFALSYYITGRLKKNQKVIVQYLKDGVVEREVEVSLDSNDPIVTQLDSIRQDNQ
ncbi:TPA: hypothetical protein L9M49_005133 [Klebsiella quasipneumoniae subsp. quasipneumoniae]|nr:hypothetical protein [Klebsiella quasipneumoniae subsp. quasipneumoniae]